MFSLGAFTFLSPWLLAALAAVPVLLWILRVIPPQPKTIKFPAFFLLKDIKSDIKSAAKTPWWLLLLRALAVICLIFALADPVLKIDSSLPGSGGTVMIAIDNGWSGAANWPERMAKIKEYLPQIKRQGRSVMILPTAASAQDGKVHSYGVMDADDAVKFIERLQPQSWPADNAQALAVADAAIKDNKISHTLFFSDGLSGDGTPALLDKLREGGGITVFNDDKVNVPYILRKKAQTPGQLAFTLERAVGQNADTPVSLVAYGQSGNVLDIYKGVFASGNRQLDVQWDLPKEMKGDVARVALAQTPMASAVFLTDSQWQQHPVGIVSDSTNPDNEGFLNEIYYLKRALGDGDTMNVGSPDELLKQPLSAIIWPDSAALTAAERVRLQKWVEEEGGFLIRFAGPNLAANPDDPMLPVPLRYGQRAMQGAMTWEKPVPLGNIPDDSPLLGLSVPKDVKVTRQVLADPIPEVFEKTWLQLDDGTPLITGGKVGKGEIALVHTTAGPDWSDFCYSGLYVETLQRMAALGAGIGHYKAQTILPPMTMMDGFGRLQPVETKSIVTAVDPNQPFTPTAFHPPGIYGTHDVFQVFNLGDVLPPMQRLTDLPQGAVEQSYELSGEKSLRQVFFKILIWLLAIDTLVTFWLRGLVSVPVRKAVAMVLFALLFTVHPAQAQVVDKSDLASGIYFAYIETGDQVTDKASYDGLLGLKAVVSRRTNIKIKGVQGVDPASDDLFYYPVIYWPMSEAQTALSSTAARNIQNYISQGGTLVIDTRDQQFAGSSGNLETSTPGTRQLRKLTENIRIGELMPVEEGHILTRSFYLLDEFPGMYAGGKVWVEKEPSPNYDSVSSVVIGGNDWAGAWSVDPSSQNNKPVPGGERQREQAFRFGVNIAMMALAGSYKSDQVHVPYILERLGK